MCSSSAASVVPPNWAIASETTLSRSVMRAMVFPSSSGRGGAKRRGGVAASRVFSTTPPPCGRHPSLAGGDFLSTELGFHLARDLRERGLVGDGEVREDLAVDL